jgi:hypothetical protein
MRRIFTTYCTMSASILFPPALRSAPPTVPCRACAHLAGTDDPLVTVAPALERIDDFAAFLADEIDEATAYAALRKAESIERFDWWGELDPGAGGSRGASACSGEAVADAQHEEFQAQENRVATTPWR